MKMERPISPALRRCALVVLHRLFYEKKRMELVVVFSEPRERVLA